MHRVANIPPALEAAAGSHRGLPKKSRPNRNALGNVMLLGALRLYMLAHAGTPLQKVLQMMCVEKCNDKKRSSPFSSSLHHRPGKLQQNISVNQQRFGHKFVTLRSKWKTKRNRSRLNFYEIQDLPLFLRRFWALKRECSELHDR